jgi:hypothetical protein
MAKRRLRLTDRLIQQICGYIRSGAFEQTACEAFGVPYSLFQDWLAQARKKGAGRLERQLLEAVRQARAQARVTPELQMRTENPRHWLLHGPGKEAPGCQGWSAPVRAAGADRGKGETFSEELYLFVVAIYQALKPFPDARAALVPVLTGAFPDAEVPE